MDRNCPNERSWRQWISHRHPEAKDDIFRQSKLNADFVADCAKKTGAACEVHTVKGTHAHEEILRYATEYGCDAIFMASHGRKGLDKLILGSETQKVLAHSKIPVLVFK